MPHTKEDFLKARNELLYELRLCGLTEDVSRLVADNLHSVMSLKRMTGYLRQARPTKFELIVDEMVAINEDYAAWVKKKQAQESNSRYSAWLNSDLRGNDD